MLRCCHCHKKKATRPRRLCWRCYYTHGVRNLYPVCPLKKPIVGRELPQPTLTLPGTEAKIEVMSQRMTDEQYLHHPDDAKLNLK